MFMDIILCYYYCHYIYKNDSYYHSLGKQPLAKRHSSKITTFRAFLPFV